MKKTLSLLLALLMCAAVVLGAASCKKNETPDPANTSGNAAQTTGQKDEGLWADALYKEDKTFGDGATTVTVKVTAGDKTVVFTVKTDKSSLGDALKEHGLAEGEGGLYSKVNGMTADWNADQSYWAFYIGGDYAPVGLDDAVPTEGVEYSLVYTKG